MGWCPCLFDLMQMDVGSPKKPLMVYAEPMRHHKGAPPHTSEEVAIS